jgi:hypothetical protein
MISKNLALGDAVRTLAKEISLDSRIVAEGRLSKFRTLHWWEINEKGEIAVLRRGMVPIPPNAVTRESMDDAIGRLARFLMYRQQPEGRFAYEYNPTTDRYADLDDEVAQSGAAWALAAFAARTKDPVAVERAGRAIDARMRQFAKLDFLPDAAIVTAPDGRNQLGITAQCCLALAEGLDPSRYAEHRRQMVSAMAWLQRPSGKIIPNFPPCQELDTQDVFPGQALAAMARCYQLAPTDEIRVFVERAFDFYQPYFEATGSPAMVPWHTIAYAIMAERTKRRAYVEFVFNMSDQVCDHQLTRNNCDSPELWGAIVTPAMTPDAFTAAYVRGLAYAARLAELLGDKERQERYTRACRLGARFIMQLRIRPEECYFMRSLTDAVDGVRNSPLDARVRIDSCQHALLALMAARDLIFPNQP